MANTRSNVWELGGDWADPILWYARGVAAMMARPLAQQSSWRFYGAMHGIDPKLWKQLGQLSTKDEMPSKPLQATFWKQCQHGSWYFLPWHRGYLLAFEATIRAAVASLGGPADWALPYWNYFKPNESAIPPAFASPDWPDGKGNNPLFARQRYGPSNDGNVYVPVTQVNLSALADPDFTGVASGGSPGFGGVDTGFSHSGAVHGGIETQPHDWVHGLVGGGEQQAPHLPGLMSDPDTAALDPIFYLHHANIDRLWEVWRQNPPTDADPTAANWVNGPKSVGERAFTMPMPDGTTWTYTPGEMVSVAALGYSYDDVSPAAPVPAPTDRLVRLGMAPETASKVVSAAKGAPRMETGKSVELVGASTAPLQIQDGETHATVRLDAAALGKVSASLANVAQAKAATPPAPDRVFLNLENVRGAYDSPAFQVYVGLPDGANPADHPELNAGSIALFGVRKASLVDEEHGGQGLTYVLEITNIVDKLHLSGALNVGALDVRIVPARPVPADANVTIGRVSIFRQGR